MSDIKCKLCGEDHNSDDCNLNIVKKLTKNKDKNKDKNKLKGNLKLIEFKPEEEKVVTPPPLIEKIEELLQQAKEGKLNTIIMHYNYESKDDEKGGTLLWNRYGNAMELLGLANVVQAVALQHTTYWDDPKNSS